MSTTHLRPTGSARYPILCERRRWLDHAVPPVDERQAPPVRLESHCKECPWHSACWKVAQRDGDIALISGLRRDSRKALIAAGIRTVSAVANLSVEELQSFHGIKSTAAAIRANAQALLEDRPVWFGRLPDVCRQAGVMFDLETNPASGVPWALGWVAVNGEAHVALVGPRAETRQLAHGLWLHTLRDTDSAWSLFAEIVDGSDPIYHWTGYDLGILRQTAPAHVVESVAPRFHDLHRSFASAVRFPVDGLSLKRVAGYLDYQWGAYESWFAAYQDYQHWLRHRSEDALLRALRYQEDDVQALGRVWAWLVENHA